MEKSHFTSQHRSSEDPNYDRSANEESRIKDFTFLFPAVLLLQTSPTLPAARVVAAVPPFIAVRNGGRKKMATLHCIKHVFMFVYFPVTDREDMEMME